MRRNEALWLCLVIVFMIAGCGKHEDVSAKKADSPGLLHFNKELQESVSLTLVKAGKEKLLSSVEVYGAIAQDTENTAHITAKEPGVLKSFKVAVGDSVQKGVPIGILVTQNQVEQEIFSPLDGIVITQYAKEGEKVDSLTSIVTIANPDLLKASFDVYEKDLSFVRLDENAMVKTVAYPNEEFRGKVVFVSPRVDEETHTVRIRVDVENQRRLLKFGMSVTGKILSESEREAIVIPLESLQSLNNAWAVFVKTNEESFEMRQVQKGNESDEQVEILNGLNEGEMVVVHGSFILKSELLKDQLGEE